jgi:hypothetical protein
LERGLLTPSSHSCWEKCVCPGTWCLSAWSRQEGERTSNLEAARAELVYVEYSRQCALFIVTGLVLGEAIGIAGGLWGTSSFNTDQLLAL